MRIERWKILVADGKPEGLAGVRQLLREADRPFEIAEAATGADAVRLCLDPEVGPPDCVVLDDELPDMGTLEVLQALRSGRELTACPVVVLGERDGLGLGIEALKEGAQDFVGKGRLTAEGLARAIEKAIERHAMARELAGKVAALREGQAKFRGLIDSIPQVVWTSGLDGTIRYWNDRPAVDTGQARGEGWAAVVHPDDVEPLNELWAKARREVAIFEAKHRIRWPDGTYRWNLNRGVPVRMASDGEYRWFGTCTDIDDHQRTKEALSRSEGRLRAITEMMPQMVWSTSPAGVNEYSSPQWCAYTGLATVEELIGRWLEVLHPEDQARVDRQWREVLATGEDYDIDFRVRRHDGAYRWFKTRGVAVRDPDGQIVRWIGTCTDIHDEMSLSESLRASEERLRLFIANAPASIAMLDCEMRFVVTSHRWITDLRLPDRDLTGRSFYDVFPGSQAFPERTTQWKEIHRRCLAGAVEAREEDCFERVDGSKDWLRWEIRPWDGPDGEIGGIIFFLEQITKRKQAEEAGRESDRMARSVLDSLSSNIAVLDERGVVIAVNRSWLEFTRQNGATTGVAEGANYLASCESAEGPQAAGAAEIASGIRDVLACRTDSFSLEYPRDGADGPRWFHATVHPFVEEGPRRVVVAHLDVTRQKQTEETLRSYAGRLESLLAIDRSILSARSPEEIAGATLHYLCRLVPCWTGAALRFHFDRDEIEVIHSVGTAQGRYSAGARVHLPLSEIGEIQAMRHGQVVAEDDIRGTATTCPLAESLRPFGLRSIVLAPMMDRGELIGSLMLGSDVPSSYTLEHVEVIRGKANLLAIAIRQALLFEEVHAAKGRLETLSRRLIRAEELERRRIALELHDEIGQSLTAVKIHLQVVEEKLDDRGELRTRLLESIGLVDRTLGQARDLSLDLRPSLLDDMGLVVALRSLLNKQAKVAGFSTSFSHVDIPPGFHAAIEIEAACYRVAQEALTNVVRHAGATNVGLELHLEGGMIRLLVRDDGQGFDPSESRRRVEASLGVLGMHERVELLGGRFAIRSSSGRGTEIRAEFPLTATPHPESGALDATDSSPPGR